MSQLGDYDRMAVIGVIGVVLWFALVVWILTRADD